MNKSTYATEHNRMFDELKYALSSNMAQLSVQANGGRSILFVYPPIDEDKYIASAKHILNDEQYQFIDLRQLLCQFIDTMGLGSFKEMYDEMGNEIFASTNFSEGTYFAFLMQKIKESIDNHNIPILIHTGSLYDMGFSNINIMEHPFVLKAKKPIIVFYPATIEHDNIKFLDTQIASKYRCIVIK